MSHQIFLLARARSNATEGVVYDCDTLTAEAACTAQASCEWVYNGQGAQYQVSTITTMLLSSQSTFVKFHSSWILENILMPC